MKTADIQDLSIAERLQLVEDLWDSIAARPDAIGLSDTEKAELDRRLSLHDADPEAGAAWPDVYRRIVTVLACRLDVDNPR